jgi:hypothetical protein
MRLVLSNILPKQLSPALTPSQKELHRQLLKMFTVPEQKQVVTASQLPGPSEGAIESISVAKQFVASCNS